MDSRDVEPLVTTDGLFTSSSSTSPTLFCPSDSISSVHAELRSLYGEGTKYDLSNKALRETVETSKQFIRADLVEFLEEALPRWKTAGFWLQDQLQEPAMGGTGRARLFNAYSCVCKLENRIRDDLIRTRVAVVMLHTAYDQACREWRHCGSQERKRKGRGDATTVIDNILEELHDDWSQDNRKRYLRSRFHDKKRFGKRWLVLIKALGMSILIACSQRIASAV